MSTYDGITIDDQHILVAYLRMPDTPKLQRSWSRCNPYLAPGGDLAEQWLAVQRYALNLTYDETTTP